MKKIIVDADTIDPQDTAPDLSQKIFDVGSRCDELFQQIRA
jgi:hypothetical protein